MSVPASGEVELTSEVERRREAHDAAKRLFQEEAKELPLDDPRRIELFENVDSTYALLAEVDPEIAEQTEQANEAADELGEQYEQALRIRNHTEPFKITGDDTSGSPDRGPFDDPLEFLRDLFPRLDLQRFERDGLDDPTISAVIRTPDGDDRRVVLGSRERLSGAGAWPRIQVKLVAATEGRTRLILPKGVSTRSCARSSPTRAATTSAVTPRSMRR